MPTTLKPADYRIEYFDSGVQGVERIEGSGTQVADGKLKQVHEAAQRSGIVLVESKGGQGQGEDQSTS